jgi:hypothetical protein
MRVMMFYDMNGHGRAYDVSTPELLSKRLKDLVRIFGTEKNKPVPDDVAALLKLDLLTQEAFDESEVEYLYEIPFQRGGIYITEPCTDSITAYEIRL